MVNWTRFAKRPDKSWINSLAHSPSRVPTSQLGTNFVSAWAPAGERLIYQGLFVKALDSVDSEKLPVETVLGWPGSVSADGRYLAYTDVLPETSGDIWILDLEDLGPPTAFADGPNLCQDSPLCHCLATDG